MKSATPLRFVVAGSVLLACPALVQAHSGHGPLEGLIAGCAHPVMGWDHLLAFIAVGLWAAQLGGRARWVVPTAFLGVMACGATATGNATLPAVTQPMILGSLLVIGLLVAAAVRLPLIASAMIVAVFAFFHGAAHGAGVSLSAEGGAYVAGFVLVSAFLHGVGLAIGVWALPASAFVTRALGAAVALTGLAFL
jgi:urease accessory protein